MEKLRLDTTVLQHQPCPSPWPRRPQSQPLGPDRPPGLSLLLSACLAAPQGVCGVHVLYAVCTRVCGLHVCICCVRSTCVGTCVHTWYACVCTLCARVHGPGRAVSSRPHGRLPGSSGASPARTQAEGETGDLPPPLFPAVQSVPGPSRGS